MKIQKSKLENENAKKDKKLVQYHKILSFMSYDELKKMYFYHLDSEETFLRESIFDFIKNEYPIAFTSFNLLVQSEHLSRYERLKKDEELKRFKKLEEKYKNRHNNQYVCNENTSIDCNSWQFD